MNISYKILGVLLLLSVCVSAENGPKPDASGALPGNPDIVEQEFSVILHNKRFRPSNLKVRRKVNTRIVFTTTAPNPAAILIEQLGMQRWVAKDVGRIPSSEVERSRFEATGELNHNKVTEIQFMPTEGYYTFIDAVSGAQGEIQVTD